MGGIVWGFEVVEAQKQRARISGCVEAFLACLDRGHGSILVANSDLGLFKEACQLRGRAFFELEGRVHYSHWSHVTQVSVI